LLELFLKAHFDSYREKGLLPPELSELDGMKLFDKMELLKVWRNNLKGISYEDKKLGAILRGAVDDMLVDGKKLVVLDFKTRGFPLKEDTHEHYQDQLNIYAWLLEKLGYKTEDFAYLLFYHPKEVLETGEVVFNTDLKKMKITPEHAEKLFKKAIKMLNEDCPKETCVWCEKI
jgi:RecB family exonuclease